MLVVHVHVHVLADKVEAFKAASVDNAAHSLLEPGIARFDIVQEQADPTRFVLVEAYLDEHAPAAHKQTAHYQRWRDSVESMMAEPRRSTRYVNVAPKDEQW
jgi:quinol monooxygenase YgiN